MDSKILPYLEKVVYNVIKETRYEIYSNYEENKTIDDLLVEIFFPMYNYDEGYVYTESEILDYMARPNWMPGTVDINYFKNHYGLTEDETETVLGMFLKELSHMIYSEMEKHKTF